MAVMEATIMDSDFDIIGIVDDYQSIIWTERYSEAGDFEIYGNTSSSIAKYAKLGNYVRIPESDRVMIIEDIQIDESTNSNKILVRGRSLESILMRRLVWKQTIFYGNVQDGIKKLLNENVIAPEDTNRTIPNFIFLESEDPAVTSCSVESAQFTGDTLYSVFQQLLEPFNLGFKIILTDEHYIVCTLYAGVDRSYSQSDRPYVVFGQDFDNIISSKLTNNMTKYCNLALIAGEDEGSDRKTAVYTKEDTEPAGLNRYELFVDARDVSSKTDGGTLSPTDYQNQLITRGAEKLSENDYDWTFDAQIDTVKSYQFKKDYYLGDILQLIGLLDIKAKLKITSFIRCNDTRGYSAYPQFKIIDFNENS